MRYYFQIVIDGWTDEKESVLSLKSNLEGELWHQDSNVYEPRFFDVGKEGDNPGYKDD